MKKVAIILILLFLSFVLLSTNLFPSDRDLLKKAEQLTGKKDFDKALTLLEQGEKEFPQSDRILAAKSEVLLKLKRWPDALAAAIKRTEVAKRKSPWHCMAVVSIYVEMKNMDKAFKWLIAAVDRGFLSYSELDNEEFEPLKKDKRFEPIVKRIKDKIGIGKAPKDFTINLLSNEAFTLSKQKGKVILIDFWAVWCPPCVKGIPHLKEIYKEQKSKGFEIIGISLDAKKETAAKYIQDKALNWKMACSGKAWFDDIVRMYNVNLIPSYWLIDRKGKLRDFGMHLRDKKKIKAAIEKLVAEK
jgi:thiol-disulfide isomerase/thioredoxin